jgi:lipid-A-disaccharide synthase
VKYFPEYQFVVACVKNLSGELYQKIIGDIPVRLVTDKTYEVLYISEAALVASGTATLETALFNIPQVVCFRGDFFSMVIAWAVIKVKYISLVNLILGYEAVRELIQYDLTEKKLLAELRTILPGGSKRVGMIEDYIKIRDILGPEGASERVALDMVEELGRMKG